MASLFEGSTGMVRNTTGWIMAECEWVDVLKQQEWSRGHFAGRIDKSAK